VDEYKGRLDEEGERLCGIITSSTIKMSELIDDLLNFSRIGRSTLTPRRLNMNELVASVFNDITAQIDKNRIKIEIKNLTETQADAALMKIVWNNLLSNAVKYSSKRRDPLIIVESEISENMITYMVTDNGAGFDMKYCGKLFGVFQRLHSESEFEGNGVGLAIVHRIITRHSGKVWAEGKPGEEAKFFISLPLS
jgi:light-regulated signal transduction histidine kinase (bacteriophytochrome)